MCLFLVNAWVPWTVVLMQTSSLTTCCSSPAALLVAGTACLSSGLLVYAWRQRFLIRNWFYPARRLDHIDFSAFVFLAASWTCRLDDNCLRFKFHKRISLRTLEVLGWFSMRSLLLSVFPGRYPYRVSGSSRIFQGYGHCNACTWLHRN